MRAYLPSYELRVPQTFEEALALLADGAGAWKPFAGGTDLMVLLEAGRLEHRKFFSIWHLSEMRTVVETRGSVTLGALVTYAQIQQHPTLRAEFPLLCRAASETGGPAIQNRGTLGGNIANASPAADSPPALIVYDAEVELVSAAGARWVDYRKFHTGYKQTVMRPDELLTRVRLSRGGRPWRQYYRKVGTRRAQAISKVCMAAAAEVGDGRLRDVRLALGSVAPTVLHCAKAEAALEGRALDDGAALAEARSALASEIAPIDDIRSTALYRQRVAANLLEDFLSQLRDGLS